MREVAAVGSKCFALGAPHETDFRAKFDFQKDFQRGEKLFRKEKNLRSVLAKFTKSLILNFGEMAERSKAHAWKACEVFASAGSNPALSAN